MTDRRSKSHMFDIVERFVRVYGTLDHITIRNGQKCEYWRLHDGRMYMIVSPAKNEEEKGNE